MSDRPPNDTNKFSGGWHAPDAVHQWQGETVAVAPVKRLPAFPANLSQTPENAGGWHLPRPEDTLYSVGDEIDVLGIADRAVVNDAAPVVQRPEDILKELTQGAAKANLPRPEDAVPRFERDTAPVDDEVTDDADAFAQLEALGALDDADDITQDDEAFSMSEMMALASLGEAEADGLDEFDTADMSPAQRALFEQASAVADEMETGQQETYDAGATMPVEDTSSLDADDNDAAAYARRMAEQYSSGSDTGFGQQTEQVDSSFDQQLTPQELELAQKLREARRQVRILRRTYENEEIDYTQLRGQLQNYNVYDDNTGVWWSYGSENNVWYRYDNASGQWIESEPPVPVDAGAPRTETGQLDPNDVIAGSMPYLPDDGSQAPAEISGDYDPNAYNTAQSQYSDIYGTGDTPLPNPDQPAIDTNATIVGDYFDADELPYAQPTVQNMNAVDQTYYNPPAEEVVPDGAFYQPPQQANVSGYDDYAYNDPNAPQFDGQAQAGTTYEEYAQVEQSNLVRNILFALVGVLALVLIGVVAFIFAAMSWYNNTVSPYEGAIAALLEEPTDFQNAQILDANGDLIRELVSGDGAREIVDLTQGEVSPYMVHAIVSREDDSFYENSGVAFVSIIRAFVQNIRNEEIISGASTITQQIVGSSILQDNAVTPGLKAQEVALALEVADTYSKNELLNIYLNLVPFGNQTFGVQAAAEFYFDKDAADLNMAEAAMLAGVLSSPEATNPVVNREAAFDNMRATITRMIEVGCLDFQHGQWATEDVTFCINDASTYTSVDDDGNANSADLYSITGTDPITGDTTYGGILSLWLGEVVSKPYQRRSDDQLYPFFVRDVISDIEAVYGPGALTQRGLTVRTTLIPRIQERAEAAVAFQVEGFSTNGVNNGAAVVINPTNGQILAQVGSPNFNAEGGQVDNTQAYHQPGSAIKPILYAAAMDPTGTNSAVSPAEILWDVPTTYTLASGQEYTPENINPNLFTGPVPIRYALQQSLNVPAVDALNRLVGPDDFRNTALNMGIEFDPNNSAITLASALGSNETSLLSLTTAYGAIANDGVWIQPYRIVEIMDADGNVLPLPQRAPNRQAIAAETAYLLQNVMSDHPARGNAFGAFGAALSGQAFNLEPRGYVAVKTGTSNGARDLTTIGFTNQMVVGVWFGELDNNPTTGNLSAGQVAAPAWQSIMEEAIRPELAQGLVQPFSNPATIRQDVVCQFTGTIFDNSFTCPNRYTEFYWNNYPPAPSNQGFVQTLAIDSWTQLLYDQTLCPEHRSDGQFANINNNSAVNWLNNSNQGRNILQTLNITPPLRPAPTQTCPQNFPTVDTIVPADNAVVTGSLDIVGIVNVPDGTLQGWQLQIAPANNTQTFNALMNQRSDQVTSGSTLLTWDSRSRQNGTYILRLEALSNAGGFIRVDTPITINNIAPTPTPIPTTVPVIEQPGFTPLPFETPNG